MHRLLQIGIFPLFLAFSTLNSQEGSLLNHAETLFDEGLYQDALPLYQELKQSSTLDPKLQDFSTIRLAECQLELKDDLQVLESLKHPLPNQALERAYLLAVAYRHLKKYMEALETLRPYQQNPKQDINLELGLDYFYLNQLPEASRFLSALTLDPNNFSTYAISQLYLTRIALINQEADQAQIYLDRVKQVLAIDHLLYFEATYLQGLTFALMRKEKEAIAAFEQALPKKNEKDCAWYQDTLYQLALCYLNLAKQPDISQEDFLHLSSKAENALQKILFDSQDETISLTLAEAFLLKAKRLADETAYRAAQQLLSQTPFSEKGQNQALVLLAAAAPTYLEREQLYQVLTSETQHLNPYYPQSWYQRGMNSLEEGLKLKESNSIQADALFSQAALCFEHAFTLLEIKDIPQAALAAKYQVLTYYYQNTPASIQKAQELLNLLLDQKAEFISKLSEPEELYKISGILYFKEKEFDKAEQLFAQLIQDYPQSEQKNEIWFWRAKCAKAKGNKNRMQEHLQQIFNQDPQSSYAAPAYFHFYSYPDYLHGSHKAIKHLQAMDQRFPNHPLLITAYYLIGLNYKKDRVAENNKVQRHKNWTAAITAFQEAEILFDSLARKGRIPPSDLAYYTQVCYRSTLERALTNLAIAEESSGSKKQIYLTYAENVFKQILDHCMDPILSEAKFWLAQTYIKENELEQASQILTSLLEDYQQKGKNKGYFFSQAWYEKGKLTTDPVSALQSFKQAEQTALGLNPDQKLEIWIQQSLCYKKLQQLDEAIRILSKVVNDESISGLRLKAMFMRAEIYTLQGRPELALKQLEALSKKGGEWGIKAKEKLEKEYGYQ